MKKQFKFLTIVSLVAFLLSLSMVFFVVSVIKSNAQETKKNTIDNVVTLSTKVLSQDPKTLEIPVLLSVSSTIESDRVQVVWFSPRGLSIKGDSTVVTSVSPDKPTVVEAIFIPSKVGQFEINVSVQIVKSAVNYIGTSSTKVDINSLLQIMPESVVTAKVKDTYALRDGFLYIAIGLAVVALIIGGIYFFLIWFNSED